MTQVDMSGLLDKFKKAKQLKREVMAPAYRFFHDLTPIRTGNARANTNLETNNYTSVIRAQYPYAFVLDAGRGFRDGQMRGSDQAPDGMSGPTQKYITKLVSDYLKKWGKKG
jgi:hypothetical protein